MRAPLRKPPVPQPVIQHDRGQRRRHPKNKKLWAYLAQYIARQAAVVPYIPPQPQIDDAAGHKLQAGNDARPDKDLLPQRHLPWNDLIDQP